MKKLLLVAGAALVASSSMAMLRQSAFTELDLTSLLSNGYFHGNMLTADFDNDGFQELLVKGRDLNAGWATDIKVLKLGEDGTSFASVTDITTADGYNWERVAYTIDFNNDGNVDLLLANSWGSILLKGNGDGTFDEVDKETFVLEGELNIENGEGTSDQEKWYTGTMGIADFNNDGYPDIVTFCGNPREDQGTPVIFFNDNGTGKFIKDENTGIEAQRGGTLCVGDYNADGNVDILVSGWADTDRVYIWKNNGSGKFTRVALPDDAGTENGQVIFADLSGNGLLDVFVTGTSCPNNWANAAWYYKNNGDDTFTKVDLGLTGCQKGGADWCDLNGDGTIDLVYIGDGLDNGVIAYNEGADKFTAITNKLGQHRGGAVVLAQDINGNNMPDILVMGYRDAGAPHFQAYNGMGNKIENVAPNAPANLKMTANGSKTTLSWDAASDVQNSNKAVTPAEALRYNYYVKTTDGQVIAAVPADPATGKLRQGNVNAASAAKSVTLNIASDKIAEWGVQAIDAGKLAGAFAKYSGETAVELVAEGEAEAEYFNLQGVRVSEPANGVFIRRQGSKVEKVVVK